MKVADQRPTERAVCAEDGDDQDHAEGGDERREYRQDAAPNPSLVGQEPHHDQRRDQIELDLDLQGPGRGIQSRRRVKDEPVHKNQACRVTGAQALAGGIEVHRMLRPVSDACQYQERQSHQNCVRGSDPEDAPKIKSADIDHRQTLTAVHEWPDDDEAAYEEKQTDADFAVRHPFQKPGVIAGIEWSGHRQAEHPDANMPDNDERDGQRSQSIQWPKIGGTYPGPAIAVGHGVDVVPRLARFRCNELGWAHRFMDCGYHAAAYSSGAEIGRHSPSAAHGGKFVAPSSRTVA